MPFVRVLFLRGQLAIHLDRGRLPVHLDGLPVGVELREMLVLTVKQEVDLPAHAASVLCDEQRAKSVGIIVLDVNGAVQESDHICVLFDLTGRAQVSELGHIPVATRTTELRQHNTDHALLPE